MTDSEKQPARTRPLIITILAGLYMVAGTLGVGAVAWATISSFTPDDNGNNWGFFMLILAPFLATVPALMIPLGRALWKGSRTAWIINLVALGLAAVSSIPTADVILLLPIALILALFLVSDSRRFYAPASPVAEDQ